MPPQDEPNSPLEAYRQIIDQLAGETIHEGPGEIVRQKGIYSAAHAEYNAFLAQLTDEQRQLVGRMLYECRSGAIHDVLAVLEWWTECRDVQLTFKGETIPLFHYDGMHMDYVGRELGHPWPGEEDSGPPQAYPKSRQELARIAEADAKITDRKCPHCGQPCPSYRKTCKHCRKPVGTE